MSKDEIKGKDIQTFPLPAKRIVVKLTGAKDGFQIFYDWVEGTTLCAIHDERGKLVATGVGHITAIGPAVMVLETPEEILEMVGLDYRRVVPAPRNIKKLNYVKLWPLQPVNQIGML